MIRGPVALQLSARSTKLAPQEVDRLGRNSPIGPFVTSTWIAIERTCPTTCPFLRDGCYADACSWLPTKLNAAARSLTGRDVNAIEADVIDSTFGRGVPQDGGRHGDRGRDLRLHVSGDFASAEGARLVAAACDRYVSRNGGVPWTYTHRWRELVPPELWPVQVLASTETPTEAQEAMDLGWAAAMTVREFRDGAKAFSISGSSLTYVPCPEQALGASRRSCVECRLCMDVARLRNRGIVIAFAAHGRDARKARNHLPVLT